MITLFTIKGKKYAVLGLGKSGMATALTLRASKADFIVWDDNADSRAEALVAGFTVVDPMMINPADYTAMVISPGIPHTHPKPHPAATHFHAAGIPIIGDIELLFQASPLTTYIGITGTNGKSTTTALIGHILKNSYRKVQVGGNLGTPVLSFQPMGADSFCVLELSSYQLELIKHNRLRVAVLLNITPDHLNRHGGMEGYIDAKKRIISTAAPQNLIIGVDEPETRKIVGDVKTYRHLQVEEISVNHPVRSGIELRGSIMVAHRLTGSKDIIDLNTLTNLPGTHNWQNAAAAFAACRALGLSFDLIEHGLRTFPGLMHRQQNVGVIKNARFVNDSKATNADAASKALACYNNVYWILGGRPKEGGLNGLEEYMPAVRHAFIIGEAENEFAAWCEGKIPYTRSGTLESATIAAAKMAWQDNLPDAIVLLSPACASWDQFKSFEHRGEVFAADVQKLKQQFA